ncbi:sterol desaturase family protein [Sandaracinobacteroides saxicola]|uniref:Sterol desaturase family protein n=1 Tax=Sandaracinobacteroides saxicola TaxID=2759707 RepID=A0A7G5IFK5_9SPHN|nr:sterol desaturase family protein [Sandaracinobacteroides saxicola]QMW22147.1 sterol desaturase family protein [Sandaracinobacteroides saxicola]
MSLWTGLLLLLLTILVMEIVAYVSHRWVMHGFLWSLHKSHHEPRHGLFEKNDWFAVMGAVPSIIMILLGTLPGFWDGWLYIGLGTTAYGAIYFGFHDIIVHRRIETGYVPRSAYMKRIVQAHRLHHAVASKHGTVSFGFIWAPPVRELLAELESNRSAVLRTNDSQLARAD